MLVKYLRDDEIVVTDAERESLLKTFPILNEMRDLDLKEKVIRVWVRCWRMCGIERIEDIPNYNENKGGRPFIEHARCVAEIAYEMGKAYVQEYNLPLNFDHVIAAGMLHDVDKPICYEFDANGKMALSKFGAMVPHGCYGTVAALEAGIPIEVAHVPECHSLHGSRVHSGTPEGILVEYADKASARSLQVGSGGLVAPKTGYGG